MSSFLTGIHTPHRKNTLKKPTVRMETPKTVSIPMSMHIGRPAVPTVKVGDLVKVGTKIGEANGPISAHVFASVSGKVVKIADNLQSDGSTVPAVVIESDGALTPDESLAAPVIESREDLIAAVRASGIVGLGGAGFPTHVKLDVGENPVEYLVVNGAECEPYVTSDTVTMMTRTDDMAYALKELKRWLNIDRVIFGIENNKKQAIESVRKMLDSMQDDKMAVKVLPPVYPQGGEKVLVYHTTGRRIPAGKLPIHVGCVVINCTTLAAIGTYLKTGMPLVEKCVTVDGGAVKDPQNVIAPIGTALQELFDFCGGLTEAPAKIIYGGPMMGITVPNAELPVLKNTNAVLALTAKEAWLPETTACIRCGSCINTCPFGLDPAAMSKAYDDRDADALRALHVDVCMECGCCGFVCPANRPLVQKNKLAKQLLREKK